MTASTMQQPIVPPRPSKSPAKELLAGSTPTIPPRPINKRIDRSRSPNPERFAQSPFNGGIITKGASASPNSSDGGSGEAIGRSGSVPMPSVGEEGMEYSAVTQELKQDHEVSSPEQTRTVGEDVKLHAPMPSLPAESAKQRLMNVTRTNSDKAASFGIGKPGHPEERATSREALRRKPSTTFSATSEQAQYTTDDEHGIPEIGQRVPMNPHLGDVQAPSPAPVSDGNNKNHNRRHSARGLPPGSYGMHGHGVAPQDELDKAYYKKHPEVLQREHHTPLHERQNDFAMSSSDLNKLVRDTANRKSALGSAEHRATPNDEVGFQASEEYAIRMTSPRPTSTIEGGVSLENPEPIHIDDSKHPEHYSYGAEETTVDNAEEYNAPILAADEVEKDPKGHAKRPAVRPHLERSSSSYDGTSRPTSRPSSRPASIYNAHSTIEFGRAPLEDVREYEPLFPEEAAKKEQEKRARTEESKARHYFPSKDVWEDAPTSVHYTAEVSTPDTTDTTDAAEEEPRRKSSTHYENRPITPAQAFAMQQEELAEREANGKKHNFLPIFEHKSTWAGNQAQKGGKSSGHRFPSKDVWEDTPESLLHEAEVSEPLKDDGKPEVPARPAKKSAELLQRPTIPERPKSRQGSGDDAAAKQPLPESDKSKPSVPTRPVKKSSGDSKDDESSKSKPQIPNRPVGGKIAALQAGFMSDLNKRLQLGPHGPKKEEPEHKEAEEEKEKVPLSDARKGRARGPQRRAPTKSPHPVAAAAPESSSKGSSAPTLTFSLPQTIWNINPDDGDFVVVSHSYESPAKEVLPVEPKSEPQPPKESEKVVEPEEPQKTEEGEPPRESEPLAKVEEGTKEPEVTKESEVLKEPEPKAPEEAKEHDAPKDSEEPVKEETLVANTAGESILEAKVEKKDDENIEPVEVKEEVEA